MIEIKITYKAKLAKLIICNILFVNKDWIDFNGGWKENEHFWNNDKQQFKLW